MKIIFCEKCGGFYELQEGESIEDFKSCECGGKLRYASSKAEIEKINYLMDKTEDINRFSDENKTIFQNKLVLYFLGLITGIIIVFLAISFIKYHQIYLLFCLLGGLATSLIIGGKLKNGALNGLIIGLIGSALSVFYFKIYPTDEGLLGIFGIGAFILGYSLLAMIFSLVGGIIGILIKNYINKK